MTNDTSLILSEAQEKTTVFISYSRSNLEFADLLTDRLIHDDFNVLIDRRHLPYGEEWKEELADFIRQAEAIVYIVSQKSIKSKWVRWELELVEKLKKRLVPVIIELVDQDTLPPHIGAVHLLPFFPENDFKTQAQILVEALKSNRQWVKEHTQIGLAALAWDKDNLRPSHKLFRGKDIEDAERWKDNHPKDQRPSQLQIEFISESRLNESRSLRKMMFVAISVAILALALTAVAIWQRQVANKNFEIAKKTADNLVFDIAQDLRDVRGMRTKTVKKILDRAGKTFSTLSDSVGYDKQLIRSQAVMQNQFAKTYLRAGATKLAQASAEKSLSLAEELLNQQQKRSKSYGDVGAALITLGDVARNNKNLHQARSKYELALDKFKIANNLEPQNPLWQRNQSTVFGRLAQTSYYLGNLPQSQKEFENGVVIDRLLVKKSPNDLVAQRHLSSSLNNIGNVTQALGDHQKAQNYYLQGLSQIDLLIKAMPDNTRLQYSYIITTYNLGDTFLTLGDQQNAKKHYSLGLAQARNLSKQDSKNIPWLRVVTTGLNKQGDVLKDLGRLQEAENLYREALSLRQKIVIIDPNDLKLKRAVAVSFSKIVEVLILANKEQQAKSLMGQGMLIRSDLLKQDPKNTQYQEDLAIQYIRQGDLEKQLNNPEEARAAYVKSLRIHQNLFEKSPTNLETKRSLSVSLNKVGESYQLLKFYARAKNYFTQSLTIRRELLQKKRDHGQWMRDLTVSLSKLSEVENAMGHYEKSHQYLLECLDLRRKLVKKNSEKILWQTDLVESLLALVEFSSSENRTKLLDEARNIMSALKKDRHLNPYYKKLNLQMNKIHEINKKPKVKPNN